MGKQSDLSGYFIRLRACTALEMVTEQRRSGLEMEWSCFVQNGSAKFSCIDFVPKAPGSLFATHLWWNVFVSSRDWKEEP